MPDQRKKLYQRFRNQIGRPDNETRFFDEDDLIDIYDYASDQSDDFTRMEALFYGARHFPDSQPLQIRRDYFYFYLGYDEASKTRLERRNDQTTLGRLLKVRQKADCNEDGLALLPRDTEVLSAILRDAASLNDEETIQLVAEGASPDAYPWLKEHEAAIRAKTEYLPTLLYELVYAAIDNDDYDFAIKTAEELTMNEPFNPEFWELLTYAQIKADRLDAALQSVDYALAIAPESPRSLAYKGRILCAKNPSDTTGVDLLKKAVDTTEGQPDPDDVGLLVIGLSYQNRMSEIEEVVEKTLGDASPTEAANKNLVEAMLLILPPERLVDADRFLSHPAIPETIDFWVGWATEFVEKEKPEIALYLLRHAAKRGVIASDSMFIMEALYLCGHYEELIQTSPLKAKDGAEPPIQCETLVFTLLSLIRLGHKIEAQKVFKAYAMASKIAGPLGQAGHSMTFTQSTIFHCGLASLLQSLKVFLELPDDYMSIDTIDPFASYLKRQ